MLLSGTGAERVWGNGTHTLSRAAGTWTLYNGGATVFRSEQDRSCGSAVSGDDPWSVRKWLNAASAEYRRLGDMRPATNGQTTCEQSEHAGGLRRGHRLHGTYLIETVLPSAPSWKKIISTTSYARLQLKRYRKPNTFRWILTQVEATADKMYQTAAVEILTRRGKTAGWRSERALAISGGEDFDDSGYGTYCDFLRRTVLDESGAIVNNYELSYNNEGYLTLTVNTLHGGCRWFPPVINSRMTAGTWSFSDQCRCQRGRKQIALYVGRSVLDGDGMPAWDFGAGKKDPQWHCYDRRHRQVHPWRCTW